MGLDVGVYFGDKKELGKTHTICTWQSLNSIKKQFRDGKTDFGLQDFAEDVVCVIVDEVHLHKSRCTERTTYKRLCTYSLRWGLTGTIPQAKHEQISPEHV